MRLRVRRHWVVFTAMAALVAAPSSWAQTGVRIKELARIDGARENPLVGYGLVVGLAGTGDSTRSRATTQSVANTLLRFGLRIDADRLASRNSAAVLVTASLPPFANVGDKFDINVASIGDARSLAGGTLFMTPLAGANDTVYAIAQGPISVGGFRYDAFGNLSQKNHPTVGMVSGGAMVEQAPVNDVVSPNGSVYLVLHSPDYTTAGRVVDALGQAFGADRVGRDITPEGPDRIVFRLNSAERSRYVEMVRRIEGLTVVPDVVARVIVNERTGTVVSGGDVRLEKVSVTHGELRVEIDTDYLVSQPLLVSRAGNGVRTAVVPDTTIKVQEVSAPTVSMPAGATVSELAVALNKVKMTPRDIISILQSIQRAGALHADLVVQ